MRSIPNRAAGPCQVPLRSRGRDGPLRKFRNGLYYIVSGPSLPLGPLPANLGRGGRRPMRRAGPPGCPHSGVAPSWMPMRGPFHGWAFVCGEDRSEPPRRDERRGSVTKRCLGLGVPFGVLTPAVIQAAGRQVMTQDQHLGGGSRAAFHGLLFATRGDGMIALDRPTWTGSGPPAPPRPKAWPSKATAGSLATRSASSMWST